MGSSKSKSQGYVEDPRTRTEGEGTPSTKDFNYVEILGIGGYGKVVLAKKKTSGRLFAVKILSKPDLVSQKKKTRTVNSERDVSIYLTENYSSAFDNDSESKEEDGMLKLKTKGHPLLASLHYVFQARKQVFLAYEPVLGGCLLHKILNDSVSYVPRNFKCRKLPETDVIFYGSEVLLALEYLHKQEVLHRDLKVNNIMLTETGHLKLVDYGSGVKLKKYSLDEYERYRSGWLYDYMPSSIKKKGYGYCIDWWGFGLLLILLITGHSDPFHKNFNRDELSKPWREIYDVFLNEDKPFEEPKGYLQAKRLSLFSTIDFDLLLKEATYSDQALSRAYRLLSSQSNPSNQPDFPEISHMFSKEVTFVPPSLPCGDTEEKKTEGEEKEEKEDIEEEGYVGKRYQELLLKEPEFKNYREFLEECCDKDDQLHIQNTLYGTEGVLFKKDAFLFHGINWVNSDDLEMPSSHRGVRKSSHFNSF